jgi:hypothetical protein
LRPKKLHRAGAGVRGKEKEERGVFTTDGTDGHGWGDACRIFVITKLQQALVGLGGWGEKGRGQGSGGRERREERGEF